MAYPVFTALCFNDEAAAFAFVESNLWPDGPVCPQCGNADRARIRKLEGKVTRLGLYNCNEFKGQFTVRQGLSSSPRTCRCTCGFKSST
jgi:transposase-like protein